MQLRLLRDDRDQDSILGTLRILDDGAPRLPTWPGLVQTQEPPLRADRLFIAGESALPARLYNLSLSFCRRFGRPVPLIATTRASYGGAAVGPERRQDRIGMRIHPGHPELDVGCEILLGLRREGRYVRDTRAAFGVLLAEVEAALRRGEAIDLEIA